MHHLWRELLAPRLLRPGLLISALPGLAALALALAGRDAGEPFPVRFVSPVASDLLIGPTPIAIETQPPAGVAILKIEVYVDDRLVATMLDPPWRTTWDAGDTLRSRTLRARVYAADGTTAAARLTTQAVRGVQRAKVTLVQVYCTVRDEQGSFLTDLGKEDFTVLESGKPQEIAVFSAERKPVSLVLALDTSASMRQDGRLEIAREAAAGFVDALEPDDAAAVLAFSDGPRLLHEWTSDKTRLQEAILSTQAHGGTALYDALVSSVDLLRGIDGKKAIVLLSDGRDESVDGLGPGSSHTFEEALEAVLKSETAVYAIGTGERLQDELDWVRRRTVGEILDTLSSRSGGRAYFIRKASKLKDAYGRIEDELRHQYTLGYYPAAIADTSSWRPIRVLVSRPRARVTARDGYYAR